MESPFKHYGEALIAAADFWGGDYNKATGMRMIEWMYPQSNKNNLKNSY